MRPVRPISALVAATAALIAGTTVATSAGGAAEPIATRATSIAPPATPTPKPSPKPSAVPTPSPVPSPTPEPIPKEPVCTTGAASHGPGERKLRARVLTIDGVVELRGPRRLIAVEACAGRNAFPTQEFTLLKAPKTSRWIAVMTMIPTRSPNGTIGVGIATLAVPRTEAEFRRTIPKPKVKLRLPGLRGTVFARPGTPLEMLATHRNGNRVSQDARQKAAKAYLLTGGVVSIK